MAPEAQVKANRGNATHSTGPRTTEGRETSSRNRLTNGLYARTDFVLPEEVDVYALFCGHFEASCDARDAIEECLAAEIAGAAWRLRRCNLADGYTAERSTRDGIRPNARTPSKGPAKIGFELHAGHHARPRPRLSLPVRQKIQALQREKHPVAVQRRRCLKAI
jgi:hypothetical protein